MRRRIAAAQQDMAAAERTAGADYDRKAMTLWEEISQTKPDPTTGNQRWNHHDDRVGNRKRRVAAHIAASRNIAFGERTAVRYRVPQSDAQRRPWVEIFVGGHGLRARKAQRIRRVILKIAADLRRIDHHRNIQVRQVIGWPDITSGAAGNGLWFQLVLLGNPFHASDGLFWS